MMTDTSDQPRLYEPTYKFGPEPGERFDIMVAKSVCESALKAKLSERTFECENAKVWAQELATEIRQSLKETLHCPRYKICVQTVVIENSGQTCEVVSRSLWDSNTDNWVSAEFVNGSTGG